MNDIPQTLEIKEDFKTYDYVSFSRNHQSRSYHQEQTIENESSDGDDVQIPDLDVSDGSEQDPQASQVPPEDKRKLPLYCNRNFYNLPVNTNHSAVHVPSNVYERCK